MIYRQWTEIDEYKLVKPVGGSRNFTVYQGTNAAGEDVAIKAAVNRSARDLAHLRREREVGNHLLLSGLRRVRQVSQSADGHIFSVMEWADNTLREEMNRRRHFSRDAVVRYLTPVAQTLDEMHAREYVHCNVTPEHILLTGDGRVLLSGAAQARRRGQHPAPGDARYSAPERNTAQPTGPWSDIYSLGVIAYEMLAGKLPVPGTSDEELRRNHAVLTPSLPRALRRSLGRDASRALMRALAKEPADRFHSAIAFVDALSERESTTMTVHHGVTDLAHGLGQLLSGTPRFVKIMVLVAAIAAVAGVAALKSVPGEDPPTPDPRTATAEFVGALATPVTVWTPQPVGEGGLPPLVLTTPAVATSATPVSTPAPTPTRADTPTPEPAPPATATPASSILPAPVLVGPADVTHFAEDGIVDFIWTFGANLREGESFDLRVWRVGEPAWGIARTTDTTYRLHGSPRGAGEYNWQVVVVRDVDGQVVETSKRSDSWRVFFDD